MAKNEESDQRKVNMGDQGNYNERVEGNYVQGNVYYNQESNNKYSNKILVVLLSIVFVGVPIYLVVDINNSKEEQVEPTETVDEATINLSNSHPFYKTSPVNNINQLKDVSPSDWFYEDIRKLVKHYEIVYPFEDMTFRPNETMTKAELVDFEARVYSKFYKLIESTKKQKYSCRNTNVEIPAYKVTLPPDVNSNDWYYESYKSIASITDNDYLISNNAFSGNEIVYKGEMVVFINRFLNGLEYVLGSSFSASNSNFKIAFTTNTKEKEESINILYQVTNVNQIRDVSPSDWYYQDLRSLIDRYGSLTYLPDQKFGGNQPALRAEIFSLVSSSLTQMEILLDLSSDCE